MENPLEQWQKRERFTCLPCADSHKRKEVKTVRYSGTAQAKRVFTEETEKELANDIKKPADQFHGLTPKKCCGLAFILADRNKTPVPDNGKQYSFRSRFKLEKQNWSIYTQVAANSDQFTFKLGQVEP
ncbi:hypothetical protein Z043_120335 [Scomber scombrus]|uniref:Uncharacterized protein n=1 Tax=Scomber scombrus TaxID=13677 RepID=A0AAV1QLD1_SCOSC